MPISKLLNDIYTDKKPPNSFRIKTQIHQPRMKQPSEAPSFDQSMRDSYDANGGSRTKDRVSESPTERLLRKSRQFNAVTNFKPGQAHKPLS